MTRADVSQIAAEVGLAPEAIQRALAELDAGMLTEPRQATLLDRAIGPGDVVCTRAVRGPEAAVRAQVEQFLRGQLMQVKRNLGDRGIVWEPAADLVSRVRRAFTIGSRVALPRDCELESSVVAHPKVSASLRPPLGEASRDPPDDAERVLVRLSLRLEAPRQKRALQALSGVVASAGIAALGISLIHTVPADVIFGAVGSAAALGSYASARGHYRKDLVRAENGLLRFLDALEHERP